MATITIRTDEGTVKALEKLQSEQPRKLAKRSLIIKAAILAFENMEQELRARYLYQVISNDGRRTKPRFYY